MPFAAPAADLEDDPKPGGFTAPEADWEPEAAQSGFTAPQADLDDDPPAAQSPLETGVRAVPQGLLESAGGFLSGVGQVRQSIAEGISRVPVAGGVARQIFDAATSVPRVLGPLAKEVVAEGEDVYAPDRALNPKAATIGGAIGQTPGMLAAGVAGGPAAPLVIGAFSGYDQGIDTANEMGVQGTGNRALLGAGFAAAEAGIERFGGIGGKQLTGGLLKRAGLGALSETLEEPATGIAQDALALGMAPASYDDTRLRPFVPSRMGIPVPNMDYLNRRGHEMLGGAVGGTMFAGFQALQPRAPAAVEVGDVADPLALAASEMGPVGGGTVEGSADTPVRNVVLPDQERAGVPALPSDASPPLQPAQPPARPAPAGQPVAAFSDPQALAEVGDGQGNVLTDFGDVALTPAAQAAQDAARRADEEKLARIRAAAQDATPRMPRIPDSPMGGKDILDLVNINPIRVPKAVLDFIQQKKRAKLPPQYKADFNWLEKYEIPEKYRKYLFTESADETTNINEVADDAVNNLATDGVTPAPFIRDGNPDALMAAVLGTIEAREGYTRETKQREQALAAQEKQVLSFEKAQTASRKDGGKRVPFEQMFKGDKMEIDGTPVEVVRVQTDEDGRPEQVQLRDGDRFGTVTLDATTQPGVVVDDWQPQRSEGVTFLEEEEASGFTNLDVSGTTAGFLNTQILAEAADLIRQGARDFASWSRQMVTRFGQRIRDYLGTIWQTVQAEINLALTNNRGAINPTAPSPTPQAPSSPIRLTHAAERERMEAEGKQALPTGGQGTVEGWRQEAFERVQQEGAAPALVADIIAQQRPATPVEYYMLEHYAAALDAELAALNDTLAEPGTTPEEREAATQRKRLADEQRDQTAVAAQLSGSKAGAALGARSRGLDRAAVPPLAQMVADLTLIEDPTGRTPLAPEVRASVEALHATMTAHQQAVENHTENGAAGAKNTYHLELEKLLKEAREEIELQRAEIKRQQAVVDEAMKPRPEPVRLTKTIRARVKSAADEARERMRARGFQFSANPIFDPQFIADAAIIMADNIADGINGAVQLVKQFGEAIKPFLNQIRDKAEIYLRDQKKKTTTTDVKTRARNRVAKGKDLPRDLARQLALGHIVDHLERGDKSLSAEKIATLVAADLQEFLPGTTVRQARDLISGYGLAIHPSKDEARATLRDLSAQMQKITQIEALLNKEPLLRSGPQRDAPSARVRELSKQLEELKREVGYQSRTPAEELKSIRDRIKRSLENQIEELQRILAGKARPTAPPQKLVYDADLQALQTLRNSLKVLVAELPEHKLASEKRRNDAALKAAQASEAEWQRRAKAQEWTRPGNQPKTFSPEVLAAKEKAKEARANFEALKKASKPGYSPEAIALRDFKKRTQAQIAELNRRMAAGEFDPPKRTPRQIKHDAESEKLKHELAKTKEKWAETKLKHTLANMGFAERSFERFRTALYTARAVLTSLDISGLGRQGLLKLMSRPWRTLTKDVPAMVKAMRSPAGELAVMDAIALRPNALNGRYARAKLAITRGDNFTQAMLEGAARSKLANKIPLVAATGRGYTALLAHMRADLFDFLVEKLETRARRQQREVSEHELAAIAEFVNDSTGSGKLGIGKHVMHGNGAKDVLGAVIFSPAFLASRVRILAGASMYGGSAETRKVIAKEYLRMAAGMGALYALMAALDADDDDEELDPRSGGFLKHTFGKTSVDAMAGLTQIATFITRMVTGQTVDARGQVQRLRPDAAGNPVPFGKRTALDVGTQFVRSKLSPSAGFLVNVATGADYSGKPIGIGESALQMMVPMQVKTTKELFETEDPATAAALSAASAFGFGVQPRPERR